MSDDGALLRDDYWIREVKTNDEELYAKIYPYNNYIVLILSCHWIRYYYSFPLMHILLQPIRQ